MNIKEQFNITHSIPSKRSRIIGSIKLSNFSSQNVVIASTSRQSTPQRPDFPSSSMRRAFKKRIQEHFETTRNNASISN